MGIEGAPFEAVTGSGSEAWRGKLGCTPKMRCISLPPMPATMFANMPSVSDTAGIALQGHRGAGSNASGGRFAENTIRSFEEAFALGAGWVETDVQFTKDGVPVLAHDFTLELRGRGEVEVREAQFGEAQEHVASLTSALEQAPEGLGFNLELKYRSDDEPPEGRLKKEMAILMRILVRHAHRRRFMLSSFGVKALSVASRIQHRFPVLPIGTHIGGGDKSVEVALESARRLGLPGLVMSANTLLQEPSFGSLASSAGLLLLTYGDANSCAASIRQQLDVGVAGFITDDISTAADAIGRFASRRLHER